MYIVPLFRHIGYGSDIIYHFLILYEYEANTILITRSSDVFLFWQYSTLYWKFMIIALISSIKTLITNVIRTSLWNVTDPKLNVIINELYYSNIYIHGTRQMLIYVCYNTISLYNTRVRRIIQSIHYHQLTLVIFLMQSVTLWPISTIFLGGVRNLDSACMMVAWYPE